MRVYDELPSIGHGSPAGASEHRRRHQPPCAACRRAENARKLAWTRARRAAVEELVRRHRAEFVRIYEQEKEAMGR